MLTAYNIGICIVASLGAFAYGYGFAIFSTSIGQPGFYEFFSLDRRILALTTVKIMLTAAIADSSYTASILGAINALFALGAALGALSQGWLSDILGRKKTIGIASLTALIGAALVSGSQNIPMIVIVRFLHGFGLGMLICLVPLYITEVAPPRSRGLLSALTATSLGTGYCGAGWTGVGAYASTNSTLQWRLPLALACVGPLCVLIGLPFTPESPRYLAWVGKNEEAWQVIKRIHHDPTDPAETAALAELTQITAQINHDKEQKSGYIHIFKFPSWRRRSLIAIFLAFAAQSTGVLGINNFAVVIYQSLGVQGINVMILYGVYTICGTIPGYIVPFYMDRVGRRKLFLIGFPALAILLLIEALLQWKYLGSGDRAGNAGCLFIIFLYITVYNLTVEAPQFAYGAEIFPTVIRARGIGLNFFSYFVGAITYTTPAPLAFRNIKWIMYLIWMALCIISTIIVYFFLPETSRLPMEEIGALFGDEVVVHLTADGHGLVEQEKMVATANQIEDINDSEKTKGEQTV